MIRDFSLKNLAQKTVLWTIALCFLAVGNSRGAESGLKMLHGHVPKMVRYLTALGDFPVTNRLSLAIGLTLPNPPALNEFLAQLYNPASPQFHKFLTPEEFTARFGPATTDYAAVENFANANGLTITRTHGNRLLLDVSGSVAQIEKAFHITLRTYRHPSENRNFFAPDTEPSVASSLPIADVSGLNNYSRPLPHLVLRPKTASPRNGSSSSGSYLGDDFRAAYAPGATQDGTGQTVGLFQADGFYAGDIAAYAAAAGGGRTNIAIQTVLLDGFSGAPTTNGNGNAETSLDIEMAMAMAPKLSAIILFEGNPDEFIPNDVLNTMAASNTVKNLSSSWGWSGGPSATTDAIFQQMAAQGQSYFNAVGDSDAFPSGYVDSPTNGTTPSSSPYITEVGGTTLSTTSAGGEYSSETVWNWGGGEGSSGGISSYYSIPTWQLGINSFQNNGGSTTFRNTPDVALTADNVYVNYGNGSSGNFGGTSCAAPLWAGFMALINQQAAANNQSPVGFPNPAFYELANESIYNSVFNDVTTGNNTSPSSPNAFYAVPNYDLCTGVGTPNGTNLINALLNPDPLVIVSNYGFTAMSPGNGIFNINSQTFYLTNSGALPLTWSLINTSVWFDVSLSGDTLSAGSGESMTVSLDQSVTNLIPGNYTATLWFTNITSGVGHARLFTLQINDPLALLPTNSFYFAGASGGPFSPVAQTVILTNQGDNSLSWSLGNTSVLFNLSATNGTLAANTQTSVTFTLTAAVTNLANGIYPATFILTNLNTLNTMVITNTLAIGQSLVQNGGFETGDFTDWTLAGDPAPDNFVDDGSNTGIPPHSGTYFAALGETGALAYLSQTLPTIAGQKYLLSLWLYNPVNGSNRNPNQFTVSWNGSSLYNKTNLKSSTWTNLQFIITATGSSTVLQFGARDDNDYLGLDDVSVLAGFAPAVSVSPTNVIILSGNNAVFTATVNGQPSPVLQWSKNAAAISGATNNILTLTGVTANSNGNYILLATNIFGVASNTVTLTVYPPPIGSIAAGVGGNSGVTLNFAGAPGYTYILQAATNLAAPIIWQPVATNTFGTNGLWQFNNPSATNFLQQFYRLQLAP